MKSGEDVVTDVGTDGAEGGSTRCLVWAALKDCPRNDDEEAAGDAKRSDTNSDRCDNDIDVPEVTGECATEKQQRSLQHQRQ